MARKQQPDIPDDVAGDSSECSAGNWVGSLCKTFGLSMFPIPGLGLVSLMEMQRRNVDALAAINRVAMLAALEMAESQCRILLETWEQLVSSGLNRLDGGMSSGAVAAQAESVRVASERFLADTQAFSSLVAKTNSEVSTVVMDRLAKMTEEIGQLASRLNT